MKPASPIIAFLFAFSSVVSVSQQKPGNQVDNYVS